jgi:hypothetical protein
MSGKNPRLNALESRKQLLVAESELNRAHLLHELDTLAGEVHSLANQAKTIGSIASAVASLVAGLTSFRRQQRASAAEKPSWWQTLTKVAGTVSTFWASCRTRPKS